MYRVKDDIKHQKEVWIKSVTTRKEEYVQPHVSSAWLLQFLDLYFVWLYETNQFKDQELEEMNQKVME